MIWLTNKGGDRRSLGEKGYLLSRAARAGLPVPPGFVIPVEVVKQFYDKRLVARLLNLSPRQASDTKLVNQLLSRLVASLKASPAPPFVSELKKTFNQLCERIQQNTSPCYLVLRVSADRDPLHEMVRRRTILPIGTFEELLVGLRTLLAHHLDRAALVAKAEVGTLALPDIAPAVVVQQLIEPSAAGVASSYDPLSRSDETMVIEAALGLGNPVLAGEITPDRFALTRGTLALLSRTITSQPWQLVNAHGTLKHRRIEPERQGQPKLSEDELLAVARLVNQVEESFKAPVEVEWVMSGGQAVLVDLKPASRALERAPAKLTHAEQSVLSPPAKNISVRGIGASPGVAAGPVKMVHRPSDVEGVSEGDVVVAEITSPAFVPAFTRAAAVVTDTGGVNSHAAVAAREIGIPCIVATKVATERLADGQFVTVDGTHGLVYAGRVPDDVIKAQHHPAWAEAAARMSGPITATKIYVNLTDPSSAAAVAKLPVDGVGLLRAEFMIAALGEHPQALLAKGKRDMVVEHLVANVTSVAQAFAPRPVVYRLSDFKTSEYRNLKGGADYEPREENPALGFRGARRLIDQPGWLAAELAVIKQVREELGQRNLWVMIPFVRVPEEISLVRHELEAAGLYQSADFKLWMMVEVPSNVIMIGEFIRQGIDGISIGTNDLTSLIMGVDRDAGRLSTLYPPTQPAVLAALTHVVHAAKQFGITSSICGQAASIYPEVVETLIRAGITSVSVSPDALLATRRLIASIERQLMLDQVRF